MGKEIVRFHAVTWPILLMALDLPLPRRVFGHGWLLIGDTKIGKSLGNVIDPIQLVDKYGVDPVRYFLLREVPFGADGTYTEEALVRRTNVDLANDLGNLLHRTIAMVRRFNDGFVPPFRPGIAEPGLDRVAEEVRRDVADSLAAVELNRAVEAVGRLVRAANKFIEDRQPWALYREPGARERLDNVLYSLLESLRVASVLLSPFLLDTPSRIRRQLGLTTAVARWDEAQWGQLPVGHHLDEGTPLFPRLEALVHAAAAAPPAPVEEAPAPPVITMDEFGRLDLRVARVEAAERVAGTDRLLKLTLSLGGATRTVVSGIAQHYQAEALVGRSVVVVANLAPTKLRGIVAEGMVLAASEAGQLALVGPLDPVAPGARVK
jgi:methionyl-tRNA synthetase